MLHLLLNPTHTDSPPPTLTGHHRVHCSLSPHPAFVPLPSSLIVGILSGLAEIGGSFRLSCVAKSLGEGAIAVRTQARHRRIWLLLGRATILARRVAGTDRCVVQKKNDRVKMLIASVCF